MSTDSQVMTEHVDEPKTPSKVTFEQVREELKRRDGSDNTVYKLKFYQGSKYFGIELDDIRIKGNIFHAVLALDEFFKHAKTVVTSNTFCKDKTGKKKRVEIIEPVKINFLRDEYDCIDAEDETDLQSACDSLIEFLLDNDTLRLEQCDNPNFIVLG